MKQEISYWHNEMSEEVARRVMGGRRFDYAVRQGEAFCAAGSSSASQANDPEYFGAYKTAERVAKQMVPA